MKDNIQNKILTISGEPASGKSTVIKELVTNYETQGFKVHLISVGELFREIANEKGLSIQEFNEYMKNHDNVDKLIDNQIKQYGEKINSKIRPNDIYIFDSRLAWHNIPDSFAIRLIVKDEIAGKRVFNDKKRGKEDSYSTLKEAIEETSKRKNAEIARYKQRYNIDLTNPNNYDLIIDTSYMDVPDISKTIIESEQKKSKHLPFKKIINGIDLEIS